MTDDRTSIEERQDQRLGELLRYADPVDDGRGPDAGEVAGWRQEMLRAARRSSRPGFFGARAVSMPWLQPLAVTVVSAAVLVAGVFYVGQRDPFVDPTALDGGRTVRHIDVATTPQMPSARVPSSLVVSSPVASSQASSSDATTPTSATDEDSPPTTRLQEVASASPPMTGDKQPGTPSPPVPVAASASRSARTIQFRGPNGTRIIWTLDPDFQMSGT